VIGQPTDSLKQRDDATPAPRQHAVYMPLTHLITLALFCAFLLLYMRTAAPSVLSGDSAEFQFAAPLLGVPHPTTYPFYMLLGKLATLIGPASDVARRVTLVSSGCAALAVALFFRLARRLSADGPALIAALLFGFAPGFWNAATMAEVYALLMLLLVGLCGLLAPVTTDRAAAQAWWRLCGAVFVAGLGFTHHGLFVIVGIPLLLGYVIWLVRQPATTVGDIERRGAQRIQRLSLAALCFAAGMTPWLYPLLQYARYGPFAGMDFGLPRHYFWGSPTSWGAVFDLLTGGALRRGIFQPPSFAAALGTLRLVGDRLRFEFGLLGMAAGVVGCVVLLRRNRAAWLGSAWIFLSILAYLLLLGPAVEDAPVFTLPMLLPWALWIAVVLQALGAFVRDHWPTAAERRWLAMIGVALLISATLAWGYSRLPYTNKRSLWLFRSFGEATLARLPSSAAVITHWEQGTTLQYLVLAEHQRADVVIDIVEPGDESWSSRARVRYADRPVFFVGAASDVADLPVDLVRSDAYADLFRLRK
jgi:Protein O-mannosyl-transferase TMEM260-like